MRCRNRFLSASQQGHILWMGTAACHSENWCELSGLGSSAAIRWLIGVSHVPRVIGTVNFCGVSRFLAPAGRWDRRADVARQPTTDRRTGDFCT